MTELLMLKDKLKNLYGRYDILFDHGIKFVAALAALFMINGMTGYNVRISSLFVILLLSAVCTFLPGGMTTVICCIAIILQLYSLSTEYALVTLAVLFIMLFAYFIFSPKTGYVLLLTPLLFAVKLPYVVPVLVGLTAGVAGIIPAFFGTYLYFTLEFSSEFATSLASFGEEDFLQKITFIIDNTLLNKEMLVMGIVFAATIVLVTVIKSFSVDYSWLIAIITGSVVEAILIVMSHVMLSLDFSMVMLLLGIAAAMLIGVVLQFFVFSVDYSRTERVQFEDDDYFYYVKAVPKLTIAKADVKVKKINSRRNDTGRYGTGEGYGPEEEDGAEEAKRRRAYEQDIVDSREDEPR